jgi:hypothetical protein
MSQIFIEVLEERGQKQAALLHDSSKSLNNFFASRFFSGGELVAALDKKIVRWWGYFCQWVLFQIRYCEN